MKLSMHGFCLIHSKQKTSFDAPTGRRERALHPVPAPLRALLPLRGPGRAPALTAPAAEVRAVAV